MKLDNSSRLEKFFGLSIQEIEKIFYREYSHDTLFGKENIIRKIDNPITKISEIYILQLKKVWDYVTDSPLILKNSRDIPIFHLLFASNNKAGLKIASEIIERGN